MKNIYILSEPRSGSNFVVELLHRYLGIRILNEIFANTNDIGLLKENILPNELSFIAKTFKIDNTDLNIIGNYIRNHPFKFHKLANKIIKEPIVYKEHRSNLEKNNTEFLLNYRNYIFLTRTDRAAQFVSYLKALQNNAWIGKDTSNLKVHVDYYDYMHFKNEQDESLKYIKQLMANKKNKVLILNYEEDIETQDTRKLVYKLDNWLFSAGIDNSLNGYIPHKVFKQNKASLKESVLNYDEMLKFM